MIKQDYKSGSKASYKSWRHYIHHIKLRWGEITAVAVGVVLLSFALTPGDDEPTADQPQPLAVKPEVVITSDTNAKLMPPETEGERIPLSLNWADTLETIAPPIQQASTVNNLKASPANKITIESGDTLSSIFQKQGFTARDVYQVTSDKTAAQFLQNIRPGKQLTFTTNLEGQLETLTYDVAVNQTLHVYRTDEGFQSRIDTEDIEVRQAFASGVIEDSLFNAGKAAGLPDTLIVKLANIFGWDIDFILDVRQNDSFALLYEQKFMNGEFIGNGDILAAQFVNQGDTYQAVRYVDEKGDDNYFTPEGKSMRKAFLRAPVNFMYISSNFKPKRFHPILKRWKAHRGIDYRAPTGTPVYAAGDGKVIASSYNQYNGKYVFIQHGNSIVTKYLHLSKRSVARGKRVRQGQLIGYVGATGLAEAPHLHYEFVVNGVHRNPRTVKLPEAEPIGKSELDRFKQQTENFIAGLEARERLLSTSGSD